MPGPPGHSPAAMRDSGSCGCSALLRSFIVFKDIFIDKEGK